MTHTFVNRTADAAALLLLLIAALFAWLRAG
jgi:hypothetical protein